MGSRICPLTNITVPVFNRYGETLATLAALRGRTQFPFILTIVDKAGSGANRSRCQTKNDG